MKRIIATAAVCAAFVALAGVTTNLVVYTDIRTPDGPSAYDLHATRLNIAIRDGLIVDCRNEGRYRLCDGLPERDALARLADIEADAIKREGDAIVRESDAIVRQSIAITNRSAKLVARTAKYKANCAAYTNRLQRLKRAQRPAPVSR